MASVQRDERRDRHGGWKGDRPAPSRHVVLQRTGPGWGDRLVRMQRTPGTKLVSWQGLRNVRSSLRSSHLPPTCARREATASTSEGRCGQEARDFAAVSSSGCGFSHRVDPVPVASQQGGGEGMDGHKPLLSFKGGAQHLGTQLSSPLATSQSHDHP